MSSYISNYKLMKNERVVRKKKRNRVCFWKKKIKLLQRRIKAYLVRVFKYSFFCFAVHK